MRLTPFDILLIGILIYFLVRMVTRGQNQNRRGREDRDRMNQGPSQGPGQDQEEDPRRQAADAYQRAQQAWDMLRSDEAQGAPRSTASDAFDKQEFLAGAQAMCARIRQSWDARDLDDLRQFCTDSAMAEFERRAATETRAPRSEPLLIEADLIERTTNGDTETADVLYRILEKVPNTGETRDSREMWRFTRQADNPEDTWRLEQTQPVDNASDTPQ